MGGVNHLNALVFISRDFHCAKERYGGIRFTECLGLDLLCKVVARKLLAVDCDDGVLGQKVVEGIGEVTLRGGLN